MDNSNFNAAKDTVASSESRQSRDPGLISNNPSPDAQSAAHTVQNHPTTQKMKDTISNVLVSCYCRLPWPNINFFSGPVADKVRDEKAKTASEFQNVAETRKTPSHPAATGQPLTHYHSFFYNILSWENPRVSAIAYVSAVIFILGCRYLPLLRWTFKFLYVLLAMTAAAEAFGKLIFSQGVTSTFRPKRYYTVPRETLEASLEDVEQLFNFFVIEFQRILFAENIAVTFTACAAAFLSYYLIKIVPFWGLSLISTSCIFLGPLIYISNKELIDDQLKNAQEIVNAQASQVKEIAGTHTAQYTDTIKQYASDYTAKAQEYIGSARRSEPAAPSSSNPMTETATSGPGSPPKYKASDFPHAPKQEPIKGVTSHQEQYEKSPFGGQAVPAS